MFMPKIANLTVFAPAKVNLGLAVKGIRPDGFHDLESVFLAVDFGDTLHFHVLEADNTIEVVMQGLNEPPPLNENIICKAVSLFREKTGFSFGLKITVEKRIPLGGGLGGGSSNAASALLALNTLSGRPLEQKSLLELSAVLGSDVPFFIHETGSARVTGRGEKIEPITIAKVFLVLVNPGFPSNTAAAFRLLDQYRSKKSSLANASSSPSSSLASLAPLRLGESSLANDFLEIFPENEKTIYNEIISALLEHGATQASLSGAGSTCFGVFKDLQQAKDASQALKGKWAFVQECNSICR